jgi:hypothetical protein
MNKQILLTLALLCSGCQTLSDLGGELRYEWSHEPCDGQACSHTYAPMMQRPSCPKQWAPRVDTEISEPSSSLSLEP